MPSFQKSRPRRLAALFGRALTAAFSAASLVIFVTLLSWYYDKKNAQAVRGNDSSVYKYLPIAGLAFSIVWSLFAMVIFGMQSATWLPRRLKLYADVFTAIELAVLGYLSFIYQVLNEWRIPDYVPMNERRLAVIGVTLLSLSGAAHLIFFCYGCTDDLHVAPPRSSTPLSHWQKDGSRDSKCARTESSACDTESFRGHTAFPSQGQGFDDPTSLYGMPPAMPTPVLGKTEFSTCAANPYPLARPLLPPPPIIGHADFEPNPLDLLPQYTLPSYAPRPWNEWSEPPPDMFVEQTAKPTKPATSVPPLPELVKWTPKPPNPLDSDTLLSPRPAPPAPSRLSPSLPDRKRPAVSPLIISPPQPAPAFFPEGGSQASAVHSIKRQTPHARSLSSVSAKKAMGLTWKASQSSGHGRRRAASQPDPPTPLATLQPASSYFPGGYVTNLEKTAPAGPSRVPNASAAFSPPLSATRTALYQQFDDISPISPQARFI